METYFNIFLEFDHALIKETIESGILKNEKSYVCIVDANVLTIAQKSSCYRNVINEALVNSCDGSSIAMLAGRLHKKKLTALNGPTIFSYYIEKKYSQLLLGSNEETSNEIKAILANKGIDNTHIMVMPLPFKSVEDFDYQGIAKQVNQLNPDIIWVSLGAPKQEFFMYRLLPYINRGIMFGIGAAFNFYTGKISMPNSKIGALKFIWISRLFNEPSKQLSRIIPYIKLLPKLYMEERKKINNRSL